jgi:hypothetical protein
MPTGNESVAGILAALTRNRYFYGQLLDVDALEKEQRYFLRKQRLLNRLVLGRGVVCGLGVTEDPDLAGGVRIGAGLALDGAGREIVVAEEVAVDPHQLTDDEGEPEGDPLDSGTVEICLAYAEEETDPVPVLVPDCDAPGGCAHATVREGFRVLVRLAEGDPPAPPACELGEIPLPPDGALHEILCRRVSTACAEIPEETCVPLARVTLDDGAIDPCAVRPLVYGNRLLHELSLCLAATLGSSAQARILRYLSGDGQSGAVGEELPAALAVRLVDGAGEPVAGAVVAFDVTAGGGSVNRRTRRTGPGGRASVRWTLGPEEGEQRVTASAVGTTFTVTFRAVASPGEE